MMNQRFVCHVTAGMSLTRLKLKWVSCQLTHGSSGWAVALRTIWKIASGVVHNNSTPARAIKRKYRLIVKVEFEDTNWENCA